MTKREHVIEWLKLSGRVFWTKDNPADQALAMIADLTAEVEAWRAAWDRTDIKRRWSGLTELDDEIGDRLRSLLVARTAVDGWDKEASNGEEA